MLAEQFDNAIRDILVAWLLRGSEDAVPPNDLGYRLTDKGVKARNSVIAHARSIAAQTLQDGKATLRGPEAKSNRSSRNRSTDLRGGVSKDDPGRRIVVDELDKLDRGKLSFRFVILDRTNIKGLIGLKKEQFDLAQRLDEATRSLIVAWLNRSLAADPLPRDLADRATRQREVIVAHAEAILHTAILSPDQAERFKRAYWATLGVRRLLDRELAARLQLTKEQQDQVSELLEKRRRVGWLEHTVGRFLTQTRTPEELELGQQAAQAIRSQFAEVDQGVSEILTEDQMWKYGELVDNALEPQVPNRAKRTKRAGRPL